MKANLKTISMLLIICAITTCCGKKVEASKTIQSETTASNYTTSPYTAVGTDFSPSATPSFTEKPQYSTSKLTKAEIQKNYIHYVSMLPKSLLEEIKTKAQTSGISEKEIIIKFCEENFMQVRITVSARMPIPQNIADKALESTKIEMIREYPHLAQELIAYYDGQKGKTQYSNDTSYSTVLVLKKQTL